MELDPGDNNRKHFSSTVSLFLNTVLGYTLLRKGKGNFEMESKCGLLKFLFCRNYRDRTYIFYVLQDCMHLLNPWFNVPYQLQILEFYYSVMFKLYG